MKNEARVFIERLISNGNTVLDILDTVESFKAEGMNNYALQIEKEMFTMLKEYKEEKVIYFTKGSYNSSVSEDKTGWSFICFKGNKVIAQDNGSCTANSKHIPATLMSVMKAGIHANKNGHKDIIVVNNLAGVEDWLYDTYKGKSLNVKGYREFMNKFIFPNVTVSFLTGNKHTPNNIERSLLRGAIEGISK